MAQEDLQQAEAVKARAEKLNMPFKSLAGNKIPVDVLKEIPEESAKFYKFVPIKKYEKTLEIGMVDPQDPKAKEALRFLAMRSGLEFKLYLITEADFKGVMHQYRSLRGEVKKALEELEEESVKTGDDIIEESPENVAEKIVSEAPVTKIVAVVLRHASEGQASDIHIEPLDNQVKVRFRVDGVLHTSLFLPKNIHASVVARIKILANLKIDESRVPQDGRFRAVVDKNPIDFRVSTFPTTSGEKVVLRVLDPSLSKRSFEDAGIIGHNLAILKKAIKRPFGMILMTGPTGSGKTTTLYGIINQLNDEGINIVSLEDPVEYNIEGISQSQVRPEIDYTFASGLRHILRQDPDVIMVGEIRDEETAGLAVHAALTGHVVLSTLHTNNAVGVIPRLIDMGVSSFLLPSSVNLAASQRLIKRLCPKCKKEVEAPPEVNEVIKKELAEMSEDHRKVIKSTSPEGSFKIYRAQGCKFCGNKGTKGRIGIFEMLYMTPEMEEIIAEGVSENKLVQEAQRQGMVTMRQDGVIKVLQGLVSFEEMIKSVEQDF